METRTAQPGGAAEARRFSVWLVAVAIGLIGLVGVLVVLESGDDAATLDLNDLPQGVSARVVSGKHVFVVRDERELRVFAADTRHLPDDTLWWCPNEEVFVGVEHGEWFNRDGLVLGGPAMGGLNEYPSEIDGRTLVIDTGRIIEGNRQRGAPPRARSKSDPSKPWNSGPRSYCAGAVAPPSD